MNLMEIKLNVSAFVKFQMVIAIMILIVHLMIHAVGQDIVLVIIIYVI